jgi:hypothetical protein
MKTLISGYADEIIVLSLFIFALYRFVDLRSLVHKYDQNMAATLRARPRLRRGVLSAAQCRANCRRGKYLYYFMARYNDLISVLVVLFALCSVLVIGSLESGKTVWAALFSSTIGMVVSFLNFWFERIRALIMTSI